MNASLIGQLPAQRREKVKLLKTHKSYLKKQEHNPGTARGVKQPTESEAYLPCTKSIHELDIIPLSELRIETHHRGQAIIVKLISKAYRGAASVSIVEDAEGNVEKLALYNQSDSSILSNPPEELVVAVKEPYYKFNGADKDDYMICVDHPCDVLLLKSNDRLIPRALHQVRRSAEEWKLAGDNAFLARDLPTAVFCYTEGTNTAADGSRLKLDLLSKTASINLVLGKFDDAQKDALASCNSSASDWRPYLTAGRAAYALRSFHESHAHLQKALALKPDAVAAKGDLERCEARLAEEAEGNFSPRQMFASVSPSSIYLDIATFTARTQVADSPLHGQGIFAKERIQVGEVVFVEKAAVMPNQYEPSQASAALYATMVRQLCDNHSMAVNILQLHGGKHERSGAEGLIIDNVPVVDVWLVEAIRRKNCFSAPLSTRDETRPGSGAQGISQAQGLWPYASHMNHSCVPNTVRSFIGDVLISRALRDIEAGEELSQSYATVKAEFGRRQAELSGWGFSCSCALCEGESHSSEENMAKRTEILVEIEKLANKKPPKGIVPDAAIRTMERMTSELEDAHQQEVYEGLPRLMLVYPTMWLLEAYKGRKNHAKVVATGLRVLRNFGFGLNDGEDMANVFHRHHHMPSVFTIHAITSLIDMAQASRSMSLDGRANELGEAAKFGYKMLTGFEDDLSLLDRDGVA